MIASNRHAKTRDPSLLPDRDEPYRLHDVFEKIVDGRRDEIVLDFGDSFLRFGVETEFDTIEGRFHGEAFAKRGYRSVGSTDPWAPFLNESCGWTWLAVNQQGYWDTVLISFDAVIPNVLLNAMASSLYVFKIGLVEKSAERTTAKSKVNKKSVR
jgi:hypothetical protein